VRTLRAIAQTAGLLAAAVLCARAAAAQPTVDPCVDARGDTLPFRPGQWGLVGAIEGDAPGLGVLRFLSAGTALAFDVRATGSRSRADLTGGRLQLDVFETVVAFGVRRHRALGRGLVGVAGAGPLVSYARRADDSPGDAPPATENRSRLTATGVGGFLEFGGLYVVDARVALGVATGVRATVERTRQRDVIAGARQPEIEGSLWTVGLPPMRVTATLLF
jgi:hypothetical protein